MAVFRKMRRAKPVTQIRNVKVLIPVLLMSDLGTLQKSLVLLGHPSLIWKTIKFISAVLNSVYYP
jgi:hypothetical protein